MLTIGMNYINFAIEERNHFVSYFSQMSFQERCWLDSEELLPLHCFTAELDMTMDEAKEI